MAKKNLFVMGVLLLFSACANLPQPYLQGSAAAEKTSPEWEETIRDAKYALKNKEYAETKTLLAEIVKENGVPSDAWFLYAEALRLSGDPKESVEYYTKVLANRPYDLEPLEGKGLAYLATGDTNAAIRAFSSVLDKDATRWRTVNALGVAYALSGRTQEAQDYYDTAFVLSPDNPVIRNNIALAKALTGQPGEAVTMLEQADSMLKEGDTRRKQLEHNLALAYGMAGKMEEAEAILRKYHEDAAIYNNLGYYAELADKPDLARTYLSKAVSASPVYYEKGWKNLDSLGGE